MVEVYRRYNTDVIAFISELLCNCFVFYCHGLIHVDGTGVCFVTGRNGSCCRSRVWAERCGIVSYCGTCYWEVHKGQCFVAVQDIIIICVCYCTQIVRSCLELWVAHTITDEQEYIFWFFGSRCCCFVAQNATAVCLHARYCGRNTCRFYVWRCSIYTAQQHGTCYCSSSHFRNDFFRFHNTLSSFLFALFLLLYLNKFL